jgi:hypothetical protein
MWTKVSLLTLAVSLSAAPAGDAQQPPRPRRGGSEATIARLEREVAQMKRELQGLRMRNRAEFQRGAPGRPGALGAAPRRGDRQAFGPGSIQRNFRGGAVERQGNFNRPGAFSRPGEFGRPGALSRPGAVARPGQRGEGRPGFEGFRGSSRFQGGLRPGIRPTPSKDKPEHKRPAPPRPDSSRKRPPIRT